MVNLTAVPNSCGCCGAQRALRAYQPMTVGERLIPDGGDFEVADAVLDGDDLPEEQAVAHVLADEVADVEVGGWPPSPERKDSAVASFWLAKTKTRVGRHTADTRIARTPNYL